ncbi:hypothetical protein, partial [Bradyrhizobium sp. 169]|uniref:hypothetical protein n=1 Tax=Bradyrhizobium sp. 169 TaxID=2782640 RepID=UPI001FF74B19
ILFLDCVRKEEDAVCSRSDFGRGGVKEEKPRRSRAAAVGRRSVPPLSVLYCDYGCILAYSPLRE